MSEDTPAAPQPHTEHAIATGRDSEDLRARAIIADHLGVEVPLIVDSAAFRVLGADSLDLIELTMRLEEEFSIRIPDDDAHLCHTVGDAIRVLHEHLEAAFRPRVGAGA